MGGTSLTGGKFSIVGTVIGVFTIQTLISTITFLGVPPAASPVFFAAAVIIVVLLQSSRVHRAGHRLTQALGARGASAVRDDATARTGTVTRPDPEPDDASAQDDTKVAP